MARPPCDRPIEAWPARDTHSAGNRAADWGHGRYTLEVSSPGLDRELYGPRDYQRFVGRRVRVRYLDPETRQRATVIARLADFRATAEGGEIQLTESEDRRDRTLRLADIQQARLEIEL